MRFSRVFCLGHTLLALYVGLERVASYQDAMFFLLFAVDLPVSFVLGEMVFREPSAGYWLTLCVVGGAWWYFLGRMMDKAQRRYNRIVTELPPPPWPYRVWHHPSVVRRCAGRGQQHRCPLPPSARNRRRFRRVLLLSHVTVLALLALWWVVTFEDVRLRQWREEAREADREETRQRELTIRRFEPAYEAILNDPHLVLLSIHPTPMGDASDLNLFHGYMVLGETVVGDTASRQALAETLKRALSDRRNGCDDCFKPRHGLRAAYGSNAFEFLICFQCGKLYLYPREGGRTEMLLDRPAGIFNSLLEAAKVPLPSE